MRLRWRWFLLGLFATLLVAAGLLSWWLHRPHPSYHGELRLAALQRPVTVRYGLHAVPSIEAENLADLLLTQGFVVARERLWQMDLLRRLAGGRLAELFGEEALVADRFYRTIGLPQAARVSFAALEPRWQGLLQRYAEGVNAYRDKALAERRLPLEYQLLGREPSPWQPRDSLLVGAYMAWLNSGNLAEELVFLRLAQRLGSARALELFPSNVGEPAPADAFELPDYRLEFGMPPAATSPASLAAPQAQTQAQALSNAWAVTGQHTRDGNALLANDPHLPVSLPSSWYELELRAPGYHAAGVTLPGVPWILVGHNEHLAWGITAAMADTQDVFLERVSEDGTRVLRPDGRWEPIEVRVERIKVAGASAGQPETIELPIRSTRHGVLIDALLATPDANPTGLAAVRRPRERLALRTTLERPDRSFVGLWRLNTATSLAEARASAEDFRQVSLNFLFAHRDGRIARQVSGLLPRRERGSGAFPAPGWVSGYGWNGFLPFARNPGVTAPSSDRLVSANDAMSAGDEAQPALGHSWLAPFRAQRIKALLERPGRFDGERMARMQTDRVSPEAALYLASLRRHLPAIRRLDPTAASLAERRLLDWSGDFRQDSRPAAFFVLLRPALYRALYGDELGPDLELLMGLETRTYGPLAEAMRTDQSRFWDDRETPAHQEGPAAIWARALRATARALQEAVPGEEAPTLGQLRRLTFPHAFDGQPLLGDLFNLGPLGRGGDHGTIDVALAPLTRPREIGNIPSLRVVFAPSDWDATRGTLPLGQSGHRLSRFRADQLDDWLAGRSHPWPWEGPAGQALGTLELLPEPD
ncbi:MAG: penicillin acylase family protein [Halochromatium sp.]